MRFKPEDFCFLVDEAPEQNEEKIFEQHNQVEGTQLQLARVLFQIHVVDRVQAGDERTPLNLTALNGVVPVAVAVAVVELARGEQSEEHR